MSWESGAAAIEPLVHPIRRLAVPGVGGRPFLIFSPTYPVRDRLLSRNFLPPIAFNYLHFFRDKSLVTDHGRANSSPRATLVFPNRERR